MTSIEIAAAFAPILSIAVLMGIGNIFVTVHENAMRRRF